MLTGDYKLALHKRIEEAEMNVFECARRWARVSVPMFWEAVALRDAIVVLDHLTAVELDALGQEDEEGDDAQSV